MSSARITQVPLREPIYINGVMSSIWLSFFERLSQLDNDNNQADIIEIEQLVKQLPIQAAQGQQQLDIDQIFNQSPPVATSHQDDNHIFPTVSISLVCDVGLWPMSNITSVNQQHSMPLLELPLQGVITA